MKKLDINPCKIEHAGRYAQIYAAAFTGEPWNDSWTEEDALVHVQELLESRQAFGLECATEGKVVGFILGTSMLFHYGRTFEINDLAVDPLYQRQGIGSMLMDACMSSLKEKGIVAVHLITASEGALPEFYGRYGFKKENEVMLMGAEL